MLVDSQRCRRCRYRRVIKLQKMRDDDHDVYRCVECGYIFSPPPDPEKDTDPATPGRSREEGPGPSSQTRQSRGTSR